MRRSPEQEKLYNEWAKNRVFNPVVPSFEERHKVEGQAEQYITILRELSEVLRDMDAKVVNYIISLSHTYCSNYPKSFNPPDIKKQVQAREVIQQAMALKSYIETYLLSEGAVCD